MSLKFTLLALFLSSLTAGLPIPQTSQDNATQPLNSSALNISALAEPTTDNPVNSSTPDISTHALAKRTTANPPFDGLDFNRNNIRTDGSPHGDVLRITKCYCIDTPSIDLPAVYGQYYGHYYGFDYYNYHRNKSYAFSRQCASGELESLNAKFTAPESYYLAPLCLSWSEESEKQCWDTGDGNTFCVQPRKGEDWYSWNGQWRRTHNHPSKEGTVKMPAAPLNEECQRMCQTLPANTPGFMLDNIPSDHENKIELGHVTKCTPSPGGGWLSSYDACWTIPPLDKPQVWDTWNYIETYSDQADMCDGCA